MTTQRDGTGPENRKLITVTIEGKQTGRGVLSPDEFASGLAAVASVLKRLDQAGSGESPRKESFTLSIVGLSYDSPAQVVLEAARVGEEEDRRDQVAKEATRLIRGFQQADGFTEPVEPGILEALNGLGKAIGNTIGSIRVVCDGASATATTALRSGVGAALVPAGTYRGFVRGGLEYINVHGDARNFKVYPEVGAPVIFCAFPESIYSLAVSAVGRRVEVRGILHYRRGERRPRSMDVEEIEVIPPDEKLPTFEDLRGVAPDMTGGLLSEDFVRQVRDAKKS